MFCFAGEPDAYCIIKCEGESVKTNVDKGTGNPKFDTTAIFYRAKPDKPIMIEVSYSVMNLASNKKNDSAYKEHPTNIVSNNMELRKH